MIFFNVFSLFIFVSRLVLFTGFFLFLTGKTPSMRPLKTPLLGYMFLKNMLQVMNQRTSELSLKAEIFNRGSGTPKGSSESLQGGLQIIVNF